MPHCGNLTGCELWVKQKRFGPCLLIIKIIKINSYRKINPKSKSPNPGYRLFTKETRG
jgi:hypothetical protein